MGKLEVHARRTVGAPAADVYRYIADMSEHHPHFLPPAFSGFQVTSGGMGAGTTTQFTLTAGGRNREYRMAVAEPEPGRVLTESDTASSLVTRWTVTPQGDSSEVEITTSWDGAGGVGGFFEKMFAPRVMAKLYDDELQRLDGYARAQRGS